MTWDLATVLDEAPTTCVDFIALEDWLNLMPHQLVHYGVVGGPKVSVFIKPDRPTALIHFFGGLDAQKAKEIPGDSKLRADIIAGRLLSNVRR